MPGNSQVKLAWWNSNTITDTPGEWSIDIRLATGNGGYKGAGETVSVTPRRLQKFVPTPGKAYAWKTTTGQAGEATADADGLVTIPGVKVSTDWTRLTVTPK